jgi:hypothetical protein
MSMIALMLWPSALAATRSFSLFPNRKRVAEFNGTAARRNFPNQVRMVSDERVERQTGKRGGLRDADLAAERQFRREGRERGGGAVRVLTRGHG